VPAYLYRIAPAVVTAVGANDTWSPMTSVPKSGSTIRGMDGTEMIVWGGAVVGARRTAEAATTRPRTRGPCFHGKRPRSAVLPQCGMDRNADAHLGRLECIGPLHGCSYDPVMDTWTAIADSATTVSARGNNSTVWTGTEMIVWGGLASSVLVNTGGAYNPATNLWRALSSPPWGSKRWRRDISRPASGPDPR